MAGRTQRRNDQVIRGTANVFADLGYPDAIARHAHLRLAHALNQVLDQRKLTQANAAKVLGVTQRKLSALRRYKLADFSFATLARSHQPGAFLHPGHP